jgi:flagellar assembly protein FliH
MWSRARRLSGEAAVAAPFRWAPLDGEPTAAGGAVEPLFAGVTLGAAPARPAPVLAAETLAHAGAAERDGFSKGFAQGERAGLEAGAKRADAMLRRLAQTIDELAALRQRIVRETEGQMVQLAVTLARRVVLRELTLDPDLVGAMAHVALERLGHDAPATIRLNPEDYAIVMAQRGEQWAGTQVTVTPDPAVARGGCLVESDFGLIDAGIEAQLQELSRALLGDAEGAAVAVSRVD